MLLSVLVGFLTVFFSSVIWEHIARKVGSNFKPSVGLWNMIDPAQQFFLWLGGWLARLSSFYTYLKNFFGELFVSVSELLTPLGQLCMTPLYFVKGYFDTAMTYKYHILVFLGTATIMFVVYCAVSYFLVKYNYIAPNYYVLPYPRLVR